MHSKRGEPILNGWPDKQISDNVSATLQHFYFDQQNENILQAFQKIELSNFFVDWSIIDAKLFFEAPIQLGIMIDDTMIQSDYSDLNLGKLGPNTPNNMQGHMKSNPKSSASYFPSNETLL